LKSGESAKRSACDEIFLDLKNIYEATFVTRRSFSGENCLFFRNNNKSSRDKGGTATLCALLYLVCAISG